MNDKSLDRRTPSEAIEHYLQTGDKEALQQVWEYIKGPTADDGAIYPFPRRGSFYKKWQEGRREEVCIPKKGKIEDYVPDGFKRLDDVITLVRPENLHLWRDYPKAGKYFKELRRMVLVLMQE